MRQVVLAILDGFGTAPPGPANPVSQANTPTLQRLEKEGFSTLLQASGIAVGLPWSESGNSESGHLTIGSGRIVYQYLPRIIFAIRDGSFFENPALLGAINHVKKNNSTLHVMGLLSSGSVHAYIDHFYALLELCLRQGLSQNQVAVHAFCDGRDAMPNEAASFFPQIIERMNFLKIGRLVTFCGRFFSMDRDGNWERTEKSYRLMTEGLGIKTQDAVRAIASSYTQGVTDEFIEPHVMTDENGNPTARIAAHDAVIFMNFREDSARQLTHAFIDEDFKNFDREKLADLFFVTMTKYEDGLAVNVAFDPPDLGNTLSEVLAQNEVRQLKIAETEKYAHVTYFFNGGREEAFPGEVRILIPSLPEPHFDEHPEMSAADVTEKTIEAITRQMYSFIVVNFANTDMVGHTGNFNACVKAAEVADGALGKILDAVMQQKETVLLVTADHGNVEDKIELQSGRMLTEHTLNPVPFYAIGSGLSEVIMLGEKTLPPLFEQQPEGFLADVAPTVLRILGIEKPEQMTGRSLF